MAANTTLPFKKVWSTIVGTTASATNVTAASETIYIPMTTSRSFRNVQLRATVHDVTVAGDLTMTSPILGINMAAAGWADTTLGNPSANSGENQTFTFAIDVTSHFNTNFGAGASQSLQVRFRATLAGTTPLFDNVTFEIIGSVDVDDSDNTQFGYVEFVCDSPTGALTATLTEVGTNQFPALNTVLGETTKTYRQIWIEVEGQTCAVGTANDAALGIQIDAGAEWNPGNVETGNASAVPYKYIYDVTGLGLDMASAHAIKLRSTNVTTAATFPHPSIKVCVFYEFSWSASSVITNMVKVPFHILPKLLTSTEGDMGVDVPIDIQEPATVTVRQSGVQLFWGNTDATTLSLKAGAQSVRTYTPVSVLYCGMLSVSQRIDSGGAQGAALTFARGRNSLYVGAYVTGSGLVVGTCGWVTLVYSSGKSSLGRRAHVRCVPKLLITPATADILHSATTSAFSFLDSDYYVVGAGFGAVLNCAGGGLYFSNSVGVKAGAGELNGAHIYNQATHVFRAESETTMINVISSINPKQWERWTSDPDTSRMALQTSRGIYIQSQVNIQASLTGWICYHGHKKSVTRNVNRSGGGTVNFNLWNQTRGELLAAGSRSGDGAYTISCFEDTDTYFVEAWEDDTHKARSGNVTPA